MKYIITMAIVIGFTSVKLQAQEIKDHRWKERVLIVHTKGENSVDFIRQLEEFQQADGELKERKLVLYAISNNQLTFTNYMDNIHNFSKEIPPEYLKKYRNSNRDFEIMLIGLDGGMKLRQNEVLPLEELFVLIDGMPMRRNEIKN